VEKELTELLKTVNASLADYEKLQMIVVAPEPWSIENGFLTPTMKIRRNRIETAVEPNVEAWYAKKGKVHWV
jgi:long-subunit acyl-CoA synthetase (AMP-forming)